MLLSLAKLLLTQSKRLELWLPKTLLVRSPTLAQLTSRTHAGMGAALLSTPNTLIAILRNLINNIPLPISCKIRLLPTQPDTLQLVARLLKTGIRNLSVHCRTRNMRSSEKALWDRLSDVVKLGKERGVPVTCNGDGEGWSNWAMIKEKTGWFTTIHLADVRRRLFDDCPSGGKELFHLCSLWT